jgi:hypothetical protein
MKTQEEIEQLAEKEYPIKEDIYRDLWSENKAFIKGYTQCQEEMAKELEQLREDIRKNTWYDIDGYAQVNLYAINNNSLNKQD